jgi:starvation-inducible DNA-binding protein
MDLINSLKKLESNVFTMYIQAHGYHWNVEGILFTQYHEFFEKIYTDVFNSIDPISEILRKLHTPAVFLLEDFVQRKTTGELEAGNSPLTMVEKLIETNNIVIDNLNEVFKLANEANEQGICNFIADRIDKHKFWNWWLTSSLKSVVI